MRKNWYNSTSKSSKLYQILILCSTVFVISTIWNHLQRELSSLSPNTLAKNKQPVVPYDLDLFVPLNNASTTFTLDDFHFILLHDQVHVPVEMMNNSANTSFQWKVPDMADNLNHIPVSMLQQQQSITNETSGMNHQKICQVVCHFDKKSFAIVHFPHFLQQALPCYSIFHYVTKIIHMSHPQQQPPPQRDEHSLLRLHNYMVLPAISGEFSLYIQNVITLMEGSPYYVHMIYGFDEIIPVHEDCLNQQQTPRTGTGTGTTPSNGLLAIKAFADTGWDKPNRYFLSSDASQSNNQIDENYDNYELIQQIQQSVLGADQYHSGPSLFYNDDDDEHDEPYYHNSTATIEPMQYRVLQILILDRQSSSRAFVHVNEIINALQNYRLNHSSILSNSTSSSGHIGRNNKITQFRLNVTYVSSFYGYTLYEQAYIMHQADIIYSPHGAQLCNSIYIRPCTVVVEFFPKAYYLQFFQALAVNAQGISYEGYPVATNNATDKVSETRITAQDYDLRKAARSTTINVASEFFIRTLPKLISATIQCRSSYNQ